MTTTHSEWQHPLWIMDASGSSLLPWCGLAAEFGFGLLSACVKNRFGVSARLFPTLEHQIARSVEGNAVVKVGCHGPVLRIASILSINDCCHPLQGLADLRFCTDPVV